MSSATDHPFAFDNQPNNYTMGPASGPPQPLTPITPGSSAAELPNGTGADYYRRTSVGPVMGPTTTPGSSGSSGLYTSPYSDAVVSPNTSTSESPRTSPGDSTNNPSQGDYDTCSPLASMPENKSITIPPLQPPTAHYRREDLDDFDNLPELLRQDRKADYSPRRPMNIYFIYMRVRRPELALHNPNLSTGELSKLLGKEWNSMSPDQKAPWNELAERLMRAFKKKFPDYQYERGGGKKAGKKRPLSAPQSLSLLHSNRAMVEASCAVAARRGHRQLHRHHPHQLHHIAHMPPLMDGHPGHMWGEPSHGPHAPQATWVYSPGTEEYNEYPAYPYTPVYPSLPTPLPTPGLGPQYPYEYSPSALPPAPLSAPLESHSMSAQQGAYPFPMGSPGFAPATSPVTMTMSSTALPPQNAMAYYGQPTPMYTNEGSTAPWDEYIVQ